MYVRPTVRYGLKLFDDHELGARAAFMWAQAEEDVYDPFNSNADFGGSATNYQGGPGGKRHLVFQDNVTVLQGDIELRTEKLDAFYAEGESQPEKLIADGRVRVVQGDRTARCDRATYLRSEQRLVCSGHAKLVQGCDVVRGNRIEFDLEREHFTVMGAASVVLGREDGECAGGRS